MPAAKLNLSLLYARFIGFCLGAFPGGAQQALGVDCLGAIRRRIHEFLDEIEIGIRLPRQHATFVAGYQPLRGEKRQKKGTDSFSPGAGVGFRHSASKYQEDPMPRMGRAVLPDYPHHIIQGGHNRQVVFAEAGDFERYLKTFADFKDIYGVKVYAWCPVTNHVHLPVAPKNMAGFGQLI